VVKTEPSHGRATVSRHKTVSNPHRVTTVTRGGRQVTLGTSSRETRLLRRAEAYRL